MLELTSAFSCGMNRGQNQKELFALPKVIIHNAPNWGGQRQERHLSKAIFCFAYREIQAQIDCIRRLEESFLTCVKKIEEGDVCRL